MRSLTRVAMVVCTIAVAAGSHGDVLFANVDGQTNLSGPLQFQQASGNSSVSANVVADDSATGQAGGGANARGNLTSCLLQATAHGCGEPPLGSGVATNGVGDGTASFEDTYLVQSSTLATGTVVTIRFSLGASFNHQEDDNFVAGGSTENTIGAAFDLTTDSGSTTIGGTYGFQDQPSGPIHSTTGTLFGAPTFQFTVDVKVGHTFSIDAHVQCSASYQAFPGDVSDVQGQGDLVWGGVPTTNDFTVASINTGNAMPDGSDVTPEFVQANVPPPLIDTPEPAAGMILLTTGMLMMRRRR